MPLMIFYAVFAVVIAFFGRKSRFGFWGYFFASLLFTPFVGLLMLLAAGGGHPAPAAGNEKTD